MFLIKSLNNKKFIQFICLLYGKGFYQKSEARNISLIRIFPTDQIFNLLSIYKIIYSL